MSKKFTNYYEVAYYDVDVTRSMKIPSMLSVIIKTSEDQCDLLGCGEDFVASFGLGWIITNYEIQISRIPKAGEKIAITTQATAYNKYFCYRNFWIHDELGNECVFVKSTFVLMDQKNRKMHNVLPELIEPFECEKIKNIYRGEKIQKIRNDHSSSSFYKVRFFDIDGNKHVNNAIYFNWLLDVLDYDFLMNYQPTKINIRFDKEVEYGQEIESHYEIEENETEKITKHEIRIGQQTCCTANIFWKIHD
ncbi:thioesterase [Melissococcus plutonius]|uniref:Acyl-ACP thioesterase n=1 Tax=Melissococcus plutonius TaxID=33970 RepID=A0A2Z5Y0W3_9ENTE|nr:acyl-ACP thioesterase domain-containing protein [Melissococcus plutonius]BAL61565.1 acyl-ACP thioesterase [Melissococcus plutonius DAT561]MCV2498488.1 acyl-[acyl-carrier-protein] thioesterase [Melissococcus plutonius]MCV2501248.1 acyl-[acyl-carrier-protein] thioesterase [Melissococcus plutonius]MCV2505510.1 acyl-[acyl-carrier-protein] thioesterase [Melissococcus plutonius]MCV2507103.1 acyl-[acyl-carrier-protein] thioesterase [Melissococcus plutonius]